MKSEEQRSPLFMTGDYIPLKKRLLELKVGDSFWVSNKATTPEKMRGIACLFARREGFRIKVRTDAKKLYVTRIE